MAYAVSDGFEVGASGEEPADVGGSEVMDSDSGLDADGLEGGVPDAAAKPPAWDVTFGVETLRLLGLRVVGVEADLAAFGSVLGVGASAEFAAAFGELVGGGGAVLVLAAGGVGWGETEGVGVWDDLGGFFGGLVGEEEVVAGLGAEFEVAVDLLREGFRDFDFEGLLALGVGLHAEAVALGVAVRADLDDCAGDLEGAFGGVPVVGSEFGEFTPAEARLDVGFQEGLELVVVDLVIDLVELLDSEDVLLDLGDVRETDALAGVEVDQAVVQGSREDGAQRAHGLGQVRRGDSQILGHPGDPLADVARVDLVHRKRAEPGQQMALDAVVVVIGGALLDHVVREPRLSNVGFELGPAALAVEESAVLKAGLGLLPGLVGFLLGLVEPDVDGLAAEVAVVRLVGLAAVLRGVGDAPAHAASIMELQVAPG